jgi:hypothetical protein
VKAAEGGCALCTQILDTARKDFKIRNSKSPADELAIGHVSYAIIGDSKSKLLHFKVANLDDGWGLRHLITFDILQHPVSASSTVPVLCPVKGAY